ncbi:MAG: hypothetical protein EOO62_13675, partial [Hymenobacter sp.]
MPWHSRTKSPRYIPSTTSTRRLAALPASVALVAAQILLLLAVWLFYPLQIFPRLGEVLGALGS